MGEDYRGGIMCGGGLGGVGGVYVGRLLYI